MCNCQFHFDAESDEEPWHYARQCDVCGHVWFGLHYVHDGIQNPCPKCGIRPAVEPDLD